MADSGHTTARRRTHAAGMLVRMARFVYDLARERRVPWTAKAAVLGLGAYIVSPYDLIPDWIPYAGWMDDLLLIPITMTYFFAVVPQEVLEELWGEDLEPLRHLRLLPYRPHRRRPEGPAPPTEERRAA